MAAKRKKEEELQKLKNEANQKVQQESERFSLKQKKQFREQKEQIQREEDERVRLAQEEANRKAAEDLAKQQKQPEQQKQEEKNDGLCPHKVPKNSEYQCARCINANNPHPVLIPNNVLKLNENPKESLKKATTKETTYNKDDYKKEKTPGELIEEIKAMPKNNDAEKDSVKEAINNAKKKIADYYAIQESDDNMTKQKKNISKRSKIEQLRKLDPDYESDDEEE